MTIEDVRFADLLHKKVMYQSSFRVFKPYYVVGLTETELLLDPAVGRAPRATAKHGDHVGGFLTAQEWAAKEIPTMKRVFIDNAKVRFA